MTHTPAGVTQD